MALPQYKTVYGDYRVSNLPLEVVQNDGGMVRVQVVGTSFSTWVSEHEIEDYSYNPQIVEHIVRDFLRHLNFHIKEEYIQEYLHLLEKGARNERT